jgi:hypothetical protein
MERTLQKVLATLSWCALTLALVPVKVEAHTGCQVVKVSNGNLAQRGGGNSYDTTTSGGFPGSVWLNGTTSATVVIGNPGLVVPTGVDRSKVSVSYTVSVNGSLYGTYTFAQLQTSPLVFSKPTNGRDTIDVGVDLFEKSGAQTNISQYRVTIDVSC